MVPEAPLKGNACCRLRARRRSLAPVTRPVEIHFDKGTLVAPDLPDDARLRAMFVDDTRTGVHRAPASSYRQIALYLHQSGLAWKDEARAFQPLPMSFVKPVAPFPYQQQALDAWTAAGSQGVVVLPTGAGKTVFALLAIARIQRPTLVVVPTIGLMHQWQANLKAFLGVEAGLVGGGDKDWQPVTVTTYDSAAAHTEFQGNAFGLIVFDECHHLPTPTYRFIAEGSIAPYRLGLTATPERTDGGEKLLERLVGPFVHREEIEALEGTYLAPYDVVTVEVDLTDEEQQRYTEARARYTGFLRAQRISMSAPDGWRRFLVESSRSEEGRAAFAAWREQRRIGAQSQGKLDALWEIVVRHRRERIIVFTEDNETVYKLSRWLLAPAITHDTPGPERKEALDAFARGDWPVLLTSKVLNEGIDVPDANVGVVLSGSGSVREHVQRLGRILRRRPDKRAVLYELRSANTSEGYTSERRRQHGAYRKADA